MILQEYQDVFTGVGKLKDFQLDLKIASSVSPVAQPTCRIPFFVRKTVDRKLQEIQDIGIVEKIDGPTLWVSPLMVIPENMERFGCGYTQSK